jgi:hypothetical protein
MELLGRLIEWLSIGLPLLSCALGWWFWHRERNVSSVKAWRRMAAVAGLASVTTSIGLGAFAWVYWNRFPDPEPGPPRATYIATYAGVYAMLAGLVFSLCAKGGVRFASLLCCGGLVGFYFLMFLSP